MSRRLVWFTSIVAVVYLTDCSGNKAILNDASVDRPGGSGPGAAGAGGGGGGGGGGTTGPGTGGGTPSSDGSVIDRGGGAGGAAGTGGTAGTTLPADTGQSVLERNKHGSRDGHFVQPTLTHARVANMALDAAFTATYKGALWNVPLYMEDGPGHKGAFFVATLGNDVAALDETTGATIWTKNIGPVSPGGPCGGAYNSVAIFGTPVIDAASRTLFVAGATGPGLKFSVHAFSVDDGSERAGWPIDTSQGPNGFPFGKHNQRGALSLVNGILYVPFGGHYGDCNPYQGRVLAIDIKDPTKTGLFSTITGDGPNGTHQPEDPNGGDSESVFRLTGMSVIDRSPANYYYPARWKQMDQADNDFGSNSPVFIQVPGATPSGYVVATAKDGHMAFLDSQRLGGLDGHVVDLMVAQSGMSIHTAAASYTTSKGVYVIISTDGGAHCPPGSPGGGRAIMSIFVNVTAGKINPAVAWCAPSASVTSPIATTSDGRANPIVWFVSNGKLVGVDGDTGKPVANATGNCNGVMRWTSPIAAKGRIVAGGDGGLCSWSVP